MTGAMIDFPGWTPRPEIRRAFLDPDRARALALTLDRDPAHWAEGQALPPPWQWIYFTPEAPASRIGADGHPRRGDFYPPVTLPRRMFAGGRTDVLRPLRLGAFAERKAEILSITGKSGKSGDLVFVTVGHEYRQDGELCLTETQDIVYRDLGGSVAPPATTDAPPPDAAWRLTIEPSPVLLFRYSALTFNSHRIHYDRPYAMDCEGYPGLVVQGPLLATLLAQLAREGAGRAIGRFAFRAKAPVFDLHPFHVVGDRHGDGASLRVIGPDGATAMEADATFAA